MGPRRRWYRGLGVVCFLLSCSWPAAGVATVPHAAARQRTLLEAERAFTRIVQLWKEQRFAELYAYGSLASQVDLSPEAFARYMRYATRTLECCWLTIQHLESRMETPTRVYVKARLGFKNKAFLVIRGHYRVLARGFAEAETLTFLLLDEEGKWRIDLFRLLALSGVPLERPGIPWRPFWP